MLRLKKSLVALLVSIALPMTLLTGCGGGISSLPPLVKYSKDFQDKASAELNSIKISHPHISVMTVDYGKLRDQIRAGRKIR